MAVTRPVPSIEDLAIRAQGGEVECFDEIVRRMRPRLHGFLAGRVAGDADADDLVQETFVRALDNLQRYDSQYRFSTWLFTIASNLATSHHRGQRPVAAMPAEIGREGDASTLPEREAGAQLWRRAHDLLQPAQYRALWLRYGEDLDIGEIAARTGRSSVSIRVSLYRARRRLAAVLEKEMS